MTALPAPSDAVHCALVVMSWVVPSLNCPVAVRFACPPTAMVVPEGVTEMDWIAALVTWKGIDPDTVPVAEVRVAVIVT